MEALSSLRDSPSPGVAGATTLVALLFLGDEDTVQVHCTLTDVTAVHSVTWTRSVGTNASYIVSELFQNLFIPPILWLLTDNARC